MPRLTAQQRISIITLREEGISIRELARRFGVNPSTIKRLNRRVVQTGTTADRYRSGQDSILRRLSQNNPRLTARALRQQWRYHVAQVSRQTVSRRLAAMGLPGLIAK